MRRLPQLAYCAPLAPWLKCVQVFIPPLCPKLICQSLPFSPPTLEQILSIENPRWSRHAGFLREEHGRSQQSRRSRVGRNRKGLGHGYLGNVAEVICVELFVHECTNTVDANFPNYYGTKVQMLGERSIVRLIGLLFNFVNTFEVSPQQEQELYFRISLFGLMSSCSGCQGLLESRLSFIVALVEKLVASRIVLGDLHWP